MLTSKQVDYLNEKLGAISIYEYVSFDSIDRIHVDGIFSLTELKKIVEIIEKAEDEANTGTAG